MFKFSIYPEPEPPEQLECVKSCQEHGVSCPNTGCEMWLNYEEDLNCCMVAVDKNPDGLTLHSVGDRLGITWARVYQIEKSAAAKMKKRLQNAVSIK